MKYLITSLEHWQILLKEKQESRKFDTAKVNIFHWAGSKETFDLALKQRKESKWTRHLHF